MKKLLITVFFFILFISNSLSDTPIEKRKFVLYANLPIIPKIPVIEISTNLLYLNDIEFNLDFTVKTVNLVSSFSFIEGKGSVKGYKKENKYYPKLYQYNYTRNDKKKSVYLKYLNEKIIEENFNPKFDKNKLTPVKEKQKDSSIDPATFFLRLLDISQTNLCTDNVKIYDGKRRYDINFNEKKIVNEIIECPAKQVRIGGYKKDKIDPLTKADIVTIRYKNSQNKEFLEFYAKKGLIQISIEESLID